MTYTWPSEPSRLLISLASPRPSLEGGAILSLELGAGDHVNQLARQSGESIDLLKGDVEAKKLLQKKEHALELDNFGKRHQGSCTKASVKAQKALRCLFPLSSWETSVPTLSKAVSPSLLPGRLLLLTCLWAGRREDPEAKPLQLSLARQSCRTCVRARRCFFREQMPGMGILVPSGIWYRFTSCCSIVSCCCSIMCCL